MQFAGLSIDGALGKIVPLRFERKGTERLFVLGNILAQHIPQGLCLLGAEIDGLVVADRDLIRAFAGSEPEDQLEIPHANADLDTVGVRFAVIIRLGEIELRLLRWTHDSNRLPRQTFSALGTGR